MLLDTHGYRDGWIRVNALLWRANLGRSSLASSSKSCPIRRELCRGKCDVRGSLADNREGGVKLVNLRVGPNRRLIEV